MSAASASERLGSIDALRGIAAVAVVLFHYTTQYDALFVHREPLGFSVPWGYLGVNLFFMISGFVIFMTLDRTRRPADFLVSRFSRLFPAYWCAVLLTYLVVSATGLPGESVTRVQFALNFLMAHSLFGVPHVDGVYWTLEVELLFYLLMLSLWTAGWLRRPRTVLTVWLIASSARVWMPALGLDVVSVVSRFLILPNVPYFVVGMAVYLMFKRGSSRELGDWALVIAAIAVIWMAESVARALWAATFAGLVYVAVFVKPRVLNFAPVIWLGAISYPLYLIHQNAGWALIFILEQNRLPGLLVFFIAVSVALAFAAVLHYAVEVPAMRSIRVWYRRRRERAVAGPTFDSRRWLSGLCLAFLVILLGNLLVVAHA